MLIEIKAGQFRKVSRLVRRECCNCMDGNCLLLDDGETHTCVQLISKYHIFCNYFKDAVLPLDKELYRELVSGNDYKRCQSCGSRFYSKARKVTVYDLLKSGRIFTLRVGKRYIIPKKSIIDFLTVTTSGKRGESVG